MSKFIVLSVSQATGNSKKTGSPFQMRRATILTPFNDIDTPNYQNHGVGLTAVEVEVSNSVYDALYEHFNRQHEKTKLPVTMELDTAMDSQARSMIIGFKAIAPAVAA